ncbi:hypothetical protein KSP39_PZI010548 [Platanthera zijinensis]|uniref:Uncharacterized protein n=1 Tax=Platanthera zijinensis TaxID=2320716 RepID=A0AAP0BIK8_9ASPA
MNNLHTFSNLKRLEGSVFKPPHVCESTESSTSSGTVATSAPSSSCHRLRLSLAYLRSRSYSCSHFRPLVSPLHTLFSLPPSRYSPPQSTFLCMTCLLGFTLGYWVGRQRDARYGQIGLDTHVIFSSDACRLAIWARPHADPVVSVGDLFTRTAWTGLTVNQVCRCAPNGGLGGLFARFVRTEEAASQTGFCSDSGMFLDGNRANRFFIRGVRQGADWTRDQQTGMADVLV